MVCSNVPCHKENSLGVCYEALKVESEAKGNRMIFAKQYTHWALIFFGGFVLGVATALAVGRGFPAVVAKPVPPPFLRAILDREIRSYYEEQNPVLKIQIANRLIERIGQDLDPGSIHNNRRLQGPPRR